MRTDSEFAAACMMGRVTPKTNRQLAERLRSLWQRLRAKHTVPWRHVEGHSGNKWNDYVDKLAARGRVTEAQKLPSGRELVLPRSPSLCAVWRTPVCHARGPRLRGYVAGRLTRVRGNPRTGKLHGFESPNIKQRRCAEGDREAVSRRRPALLAAPWR